MIKANGAPKPKLRPLGQITGDMEPLLLEMACQHDMQYHEILGLIHAYLLAHYPEGREVYTADGSYGTYYYGHKDGLK